MLEREKEIADDHDRPSSLGSVTRSRGPAWRQVDLAGPYNDMRLLLTSGGVRNDTVLAELEALLGKPVNHANALIIPTAVYPFLHGSAMAWRAICGAAASPMADLGWASLGVLELTALPHVPRGAWTTAIRQTDALLVWGGDPLFLADWLLRSGLVDLVPELRADLVYLGVSAGAMAACTWFSEAYESPPARGRTETHRAGVVLATSAGDIRRTVVTARGAGFVDMAVIPHLDHPDHPEAATVNFDRWAARTPVQTYAIDDQTAISVVDGVVRVVSQGRWRLVGSSI